MTLAVCVEVAMTTVRAIMRQGLPEHVLRGNKVSGKNILTLFISPAPWSSEPGETLH